MISRREFIHCSALLSFCMPFIDLTSLFAAELDENLRYPITITTLKEACLAEMTAHNHYDGYCHQALLDNYPNIAYLFHALSASEKIHADNYRKLIVALGAMLEKCEIKISVSNTKANLKSAAKKELDKINDFYPEILKKLATEDHDQAILYCMYSWKSHRQHKEIIANIKRYSGFFFGALARKIEGLQPNYYVCEICGSTEDEKPSLPCEICNYPVSHYKQLERPVLVKS